jgi:hypothetical protein
MIPFFSLYFSITKLSSKLPNSFFNNDHLNLSFSNEGERCKRK